MIYEGAVNACTLECNGVAVNHFMLYATCMSCNFFGLQWEPHPSVGRVCLVQEDPSPPPLAFPALPISARHGRQADDSKFNVDISSASLLHNGRHNRSRSRSASRGAAADLVSGDDGSEAGQQQQPQQQQPRSTRLSNLGSVMHPRETAAPPPAPLSVEVWKQRAQTRQNLIKVRMDTYLGSAFGYVVHTVGALRGF